MIFRSSLPLSTRRYKFSTDERYSDFAPNFIIEGVGANKPFILTENCGLTKRLNGLGVFIDTSGADNIKKAVLNLLDDDVYKNYKKRLADFNFTHSWQEIAQEFLVIYKSL